MPAATQQPLHTRPLGFLLTMEGLGDSWTLTSQTKPTSGFIPNPGIWYWVRSEGQECAQAWASPRVSMVGGGYI